MEHKIYQDKLKRQHCRLSNTVSFFARVRDEVDMDSWPSPVNATISNVPMKPGKVMHYIDCRVNSVKPNAVSVGDVAPEGELTITADIDGLTKSLPSIPIWK